MNLFFGLLDNKCCLVQVYRHGQRKEIYNTNKSSQIKWKEILGPLYICQPRLLLGGHTLNDKEEPDSKI